MKIMKMSTIYVICLSMYMATTLGNSARCTSDEEKSTSVPVDCSDIDIKNGSGLYKIYPKGSDGFIVYCDMDSENVNGGWTVFQRRLNGEVDFYRNWAEYKAGFGNLRKEFWLGNDKLHLLTSQANYELLITLGDFDNQNRYAKYTNFKVGDESSNYRLDYNLYSGNAGDGLVTHSKGKPFSTMDKKNYVYAGNCATEFKGAWWYSNCHHSNLNGQYLGGKHSSYADGINWYQWKGFYYSLKSTSMMLRRIV